MTTSAKVITESSKIFSNLYPALNEHCNQDSCLHHAAIYTSGTNIGVFTVQLHLPEDHTFFDFTSGTHCVCHHKEVTGHEQAVKEFQQQQSHTVNLERRLNLYTLRRLTNRAQHIHNKLFSQSVQV